MNILVNSKLQKVDKYVTVSELLNIEGYNNWVGVWINNKQILQKEYTSYVLRENDEIKIIRPLGGG